MFMSIRAKLLVLISVIISSFIIVIVGYFLAMAPIEHIQKERKVLDALRGRILNEQIVINRLLGQSPYLRSVDDFYAAVEETNDVFAEVGEIEYIRSKSKKIAEALDITVRLNQMKIERLDEFVEADARFREAVEGIYIFIDSFNFVKILPGQAVQGKCRNP